MNATEKKELMGKFAKKLKKSESTLKNIEFKKVELEAIQKYIA